MPTIQDFRNMVGKYSDGYISMTNDSAGKQTLSKVANHHALTFLNPSEAKINRLLGGTAAQDIRRAFAQALSAESTALIEHPTIRKILYGDENAEKGAAFSEKPLSRREVRQAFEAIDLQKFDANSGVAIHEHDVGFIKQEMYRVEDNCRSAYLKAISRIMPPTEPGTVATRSCLSNYLCALIADKSVALHNAFVGKSDSEITYKLLWKTIFDESLDETKLMDQKGKPKRFVDVMQERLKGLFLDALWKEAKDSELAADYWVPRAQFSYSAMGLKFPAALKVIQHPTEINREDIVKGMDVFRGAKYERSENIDQIMKDAPRAKIIKVDMLNQVNGRTQTMDELKIGGEVTMDECQSFCESMDYALQRLYAGKHVNSKGVREMPRAQVEKIIMFARQEADNLLVYPGPRGGITNKLIQVKANKNGSMDVLVSCEKCGDKIGSTYICRVDEDGNMVILDVALAQDSGPMVRKFNGFN